ncbi:hypothetical protein CCACVL1_04728 [Corchorus capsularis]|uniref:Uncharacterized protein n=1 Tax=Corchorus capsularis TaxID=210143 RepID=A0A1R3JQ56_COCAP|nr:hypothetical protein CCACVL1_04728 [Corchorus capsularis]
MSCSTHGKANSLLTATPSGVVEKASATVDVAMLTANKNVPIMEDDATTVAKQGDASAVETITSEKGGDDSIATVDGGGILADVVSVDGTATVTKDSAAAVIILSLLNYVVITFCYYHKSHGVASVIMWASHNLDVLQCLGDYVLLRNSCNFG